MSDERSTGNRSWDRWTLWMNDNRKRTPIIYRTDKSNRGPSLRGYTHCYHSPGLF